MAKAQTALHIP